MMIQVLLRPAVILIITLAVLIGIVRYTAQAYAVPQHVFSFDPPGCYLPCVFGVTPGKTTWADYKNLIASKVPSSQQTLGSDTDFWLKDNVGTKVEFASIRFETISLFEVFTTQGKITTLGRLLSAQQEPVRVFRYHAFGPGGVALIFVFGDDQRVIASAWAENVVGAKTSIDFLAVRNNYETVEDVLAESHIIADEIRWLGFASADKYLNEPLKH